MQCSLSSLPLSITHISKLSSAGFDSVGDLKDVGIIELSKEAALSHSEALEILKVVKESQESPSVSSCGKSALDLLQSEAEYGSVVTFSSQVDSMLGGGVPVGRITELCGAPGVGKTQFSMQLAVDVTIPEVFGGLEGEAVYVDTEGSFVVERVVDMVKAARDHLTSVAASSSSKDMMAALKQFTLERALSKIHYYRCHDYIELVALVNLLPEVVSQHPKIQLIVIDSVASPFRYGFHDMGLRNRILSGLSQNLIQLAVTRHMAVVLTNQMTTRITQGQAVNKSDQLTPALGESWGHVCTIRVVLYWSGGVRWACLLKSPNRKEQTVLYEITGEGVRDTRTHSPHKVDPPTQFPPSQHDPYDLEDEGLDSILSEVPMGPEMTLKEGRPLKRSLEEEADELVRGECVSSVRNPLPKKPHPDHWKPS